MNLIIRPTDRGRQARVIKIERILYPKGLSMEAKAAMKLICTGILFSTLLPVLTAIAQAAPRRIEVTAKRFEFSPSEITLKRGEPVVLIIKSADVPHGVRFRELGVEVRTGRGEASEAAFTPAKAGTFVGQCSVFCGAGHGKMKLILHIVD